MKPINRHKITKRCRINETNYKFTWQSCRNTYLLEQIDTPHLYNITRLIYNYAALTYGFEKVSGGKLNDFNTYEELIDNDIITNPDSFNEWLKEQIKKLPSFITELNTREVDDDFLMSLSLDDDGILFESFYEFTHKLEKTLMDNMHRLPFPIPLSTSCTLSTQIIKNLTRRNVQPLESLSIR